MEFDAPNLNDELTELVFSARGAVGRLAHVLESLGSDIGRAEDLPWWLDEAGILSVGARDTEEVPRLLVRLAEYLQNLRAQGIDIDPVKYRGKPGDWADIFAKLVLHGEQFFGGAFEGTATPSIQPTIKDLRNAIEHHGDYVAGVGRRPELVSDVRERLTYSYTLEPFELTSIYLFGMEYEVGSAIEVAIQLKRPLDGPG